MLSGKKPLPKPMLAHNELIGNWKDIVNGKRYQGQVFIINLYQPGNYFV